MADKEQLAILRRGVLQWNKWRADNPETDVDLEHGEFRGMDLSHVDLKGARLTGADFTGADLAGADLRWAEAFRTIFQTALLLGADLQEADLTESDMRGAMLWSANLGGATLDGADLRGSLVRCQRTDLRSANFRDATIEGVKFNRWSKYTGVRLEGCRGSPRFRRFAQDQEFIEEFRGSWSRFPAYLAWLVLVDCGRSLLLWAVWSVGLAVCFALRFQWLGPNAFKVSDLGFGWNQMLYYSVVTFTTLGFGDITPRTQEAAWWVMAEVVMGYVMLGGLISIFATKLARRS